MDLNPTPFRLDGRKALVTGGASGIGEAVCRVLASAGASITIADVDRGRAERLAGQIPGSSVLIVDIGDGPAVNAAAGSIGALDILVNNAGIGMVGSIEETEPAEFARLYRVNVEGTYLVSRAVLPLLLESHGVIVNIGSVAGLVGMKRRFAYCATKGAVVAMSRQMAVEYAGRIRVNCVCPGTVETPFVEGYLEKYHRHEKEKVREELKLRQPIGRLGRPEEIAHLVLYLSSGEAGFVTGAVMTIDGGWTAA
jgi:NAD(P)-dependent dehydrogenase (short-subunit alcohol dehydrogenase family)